MTRQSPSLSVGIRHWFGFGGQRRENDVAVPAVMRYSSSAATRIAGRSIFGASSHEVSASSMIS